MNRSTPSRALVVGLGLSGVAAATLLARQGWRVTVNDRAAASELGERPAQLPAGVEAVFDGHPERLLDGLSLVIVSPGVPWELPLLTQARRRGVEVIAELPLVRNIRFFQLMTNLRFIPPPHPPTNLPIYQITYLPASLSTSLPAGRGWGSIEFYKNVAKMGHIAPSSTLVCSRECRKHRSE